MDMDMSMGGQMKIESANTNIITVTSIDGNSYKAENTMVKMKMSQEGAGQEMSFDSDKKEDYDSEMGKELSKELNKPGSILIDKQTGEVKDAGPEKIAESGNPFADIMGESASPSASATPAFYVLPPGKKVGDKWTDSTSVKGMNVVKNYSFQSAANGIATVLIKAITKGKLNKSIQGSDIEIAINGTADITMLTDQNSGLVKKSTTTSNIDGSLEMMGQSMPITMKMSTVSTFE